MEIGVKVPGNMRLNESACDHGRHGRAFNGPGVCVLKIENIKLLNVGARTIKATCIFSCATMSIYFP